MPKFLRLVDIYHRWRTRLCPRDGEPQGLLILSCGGLGDTILFSHVIDAFCAYAKPNEKITILLRKDGAKTAFLFPDSVDTLIVDFKKYRNDIRYRLEMSKYLFESNFRSVISTDYLRHPDLDEALLFAAEGSETIAMTVKPWRKYQKQLDGNASSFTRLYESGAVRQDKVLRWFKFANWLTGADFISTLKRVNAAPLNASNPPAVFIQPFSAVKAKQCAPAVYEALIDALPENTLVYLTGAPGEMDANPDYMALLNRPNVEFEDAGFADLVCRLETARLVVSVDTAVMHLGAAVGAPTLCLASAAYVGEIVPYAENLIPENIDFYYKPMDCEGCLGNCVKSLKNGIYPCVFELETDQIVSRALAIFENSAP